MKIAFFSDIHANLPALEAVLADIYQQKPDFVYWLGDLVGYNIWPNEVANEIRKRSIPTLAGNYDEGIGLNSDDCGCAYKTDEEKANGAVSIAFTNEIVNDDTRAYLRMLPLHLSMEFQNNGEKINLLMVHGGPRKINEYLIKDGYPRACYAIMTLDTRLSKSEPASVQVDFVRVAYDFEKAAKAVEEGKLPNVYAGALREAK